MFSPSEPNVIAVTSSQSVDIIDIRKISKYFPHLIKISFIFCDHKTFFIDYRCLYSIPVPRNKNVQNARFNRKGTRLLCSESGSSPAIYHVGAGMWQKEPIRLISPGYISEEATEGVCFAGKDDELAVVSSENGDIHIWSVPEDQEDSVDKPLLVLSGHESYVFSARFSAKYGALATTGVQVVKLWTPNKL